MKIYLTRHSETQWNVKKINQGILDSQLTEDGIKMAKDLSLIKSNFNKVFSSDLQRAIISAKIIAPESEIIKTKLLREIDVGSWSGKNLERIKIEDKDLYEKYFYNPGQYQRKDGESLWDLMERVKNFFEEFIIGKSYEDVLIVTHGVTLCGILNYIEGIDVNNFWDNRVRRNASYNIIDYKNGEFNIIKKAPKNNRSTI